MILLISSSADVAAIVCEDEVRVRDGGLAVWDEVRVEALVDVASFLSDLAVLLEEFEVLWHATKATATRIRVTDLRVRTKYGMNGSYVISTTGDKV
jgi:hypothetical protein